MSGYFDIFETLPDGSSSWVCYVFERQAALARLKELGKHSRAEFCVIDPETKKVVASVNSPKSRSTSA